MHVLSLITEPPQGIPTAKLTATQIYNSGYQLKEIFR